MANITFQALALVSAVSLVSLGSFSAGATDVSAGGDSGEGGESFLQNLHSIAYRLHGGDNGQRGGGGFWDHMGELVNQLDLSEEQTQRLDALHRSFESHRGMADGSMAELHDQLVEQFEQGDIEADPIRQMIDQHLEEIRTMAYSATDDLTALVNSLDEKQREIVLAHLQGDHAGHGGRGH